MDTREKIVAAAARIADRQGPAAVSMRSVADAVGLTPMALYRHFADKDALVRELSARAFARWEARLAAIRARTPLAWLERAGDAFLDFALEEPRAFETAFLSSTGTERRYPDDFEAGGPAALTMIAARVAECVAAGVFRKLPPLEIALALWAHGQGLVSLYRAGRIAGGEAKLRRVYGRSMQIVLRGLRAEPRR